MAKKNFLVIFLTAVLLSCFILGTCISSSADSKKAEPIEAEIELSSSIENLLQSNRVYNDTFYDEQELIEEVAISLMDRANDGYIATKAVEDLIFAMYSINVDASAISYPNIPQIDGYMPLVARGYTSYSHEVTGVLDENDGTVTVYSNVTVDCHDGNPVTYPCETLFVACDDSPFGYNIVWANIIE